MASGALVALLVGVVVFQVASPVAARERFQDGAAGGKRQFFDSLGGMALGKRAGTSLSRFFNDPGAQRLLAKYLAEVRGGHKRAVMDALGGDYLLKKRSAR